MKFLSAFILFSLSTFSQKKVDNISRKTKLSFGQYELMRMSHYDSHSINIKKNSTFLLFQGGCTWRIDHKGKWARRGDTLIVTSTHRNKNARDLDEPKDYVPLTGWTNKYLIRPDTLIFLEKNKAGLLSHSDILILGPDHDEAEKSVKKYMSSKNKKYLPIDFGECFSSENFAKELQEKYKTKKSIKYTIEHDYSIDGQEWEDMNFHLDEYYNVIIHNSKEATITLITDDSKGDRQDDSSKEKRVLAGQNPAGVISDTLVTKQDKHLYLTGYPIRIGKFIKPSEEKLSLEIISDSLYLWPFGNEEYWILRDSSLQKRVAGSNFNYVPKLKLINLSPDTLFFQRPEETDKICPVELQVIKDRGDIITYYYTLPKLNPYSNPPKRCGNGPEPVATYPKTVFVLAPHQFVILEESETSACDYDMSMPKLLRYIKPINIEQTTTANYVTGKMIATFNRPVYKAYKRSWNGTIKSQPVNVLFCDLECTGDFDGDGKTETVFTKTHYGTWTGACTDEICFLGDNFPTIRDTGEFFAKIFNEGDLDGEKGDEISVFNMSCEASEWAEGRVYSFRKGKWVQLFPSFSIFGPPQASGKVIKKDSIKGQLIITYDSHAWGPGSRKTKVVKIGDFSALETDSATPQVLKNAPGFSQIAKTDSAGNKSDVYFYEGDILKHQKYYENGRLKEVTHYKSFEWNKSHENLEKCTKNGTYVKYYKSGNTNTIGNYLNNKKEGEWIYFSETEKVIKKENYKNGELLK